MNGQKWLREPSGATVAPQGKARLAPNVCKD